MPIFSRLNAVPQRSSMESFLDEYQIVRIIMSVGGLVVMPLQVLVSGWDDRVIPIAIALVLVGAHAEWCRVRKVRTPRIMLALDLTLWGVVMALIPDQPAITTATLAFLTLLTVLFSSGWWTAGFLVYLAGFYGFSYFTGRGVDMDAVSDFQSVVFTVAGVALVMWRVKGWLSRLDANRSQMLGTVSHELKNNLTGMIGMTELVGTEDLAPEEVRELIGLAHMQALDATEIVEDLLTASRLEQAALSVAIAPVDINAEVTTTVRRFAGEGMRISLDLDDTLTPAGGDGLRVRQVLRNLLSNAERYGGSSVGVRTFEEDGWLRIVVSDDGEGVPLEDEGTIFLPYRRSVATRRHASSVGLGLWICRHLASAMGGALEYRRRGDVTEFIFSLRKHDSDDANDNPPESASAVGGSVSRLRDLVGQTPVPEPVNQRLPVHA
jgi:signal transduction histidine kinase